MNPTPEQLIQEYFSKLAYPLIKEIKPCLMMPQGQVYLVSFEKKNTPSGTGAIQAVPPPDCQYPIIEGPAPDNWKREPVMVEVDIPNAYAVLIDERSDEEKLTTHEPKWQVSGYHEEFWKDADVFRLVLKQHLGLLEMEKALKEPPVVPPKPVQEPRDGYCKNATMDAVVERYEEMLVKTEMEAAHTVSGAMNREQELTKQLIEAQTELTAAKAKLSLIQDALAGKGLSEESQPSPEECMIQQGHIEHFGEPQDEAALVGEQWNPLGYPVAPADFTPTGGRAFVCKNGSQPTQRRLGDIVAINS